MNNLLLKEAKEYFNSIGIDPIEIVVPIQSDVYCIRRKDRQWAAYIIGNDIPIVEFGRYNYMCGFDRGYCLVCVYDKNRYTFANRGIINEVGEEVIKPYTFNNICNFYGRDEPYITIFTEEEVKKIDRNFLELL